jgi:hypothetical protein
MKFSPRELLVMAAIGCSVGTLGDRLHTLSGVLRYPNPIWQDEAWFVPPEFALAGIALGLGHRSLREMLGVAPRAPSWTEHVLGIVLAALAYIATATVKDPRWIASILYGAFVARAVLGRSRSVVLYALLAATVGTATEATLVKMSVFEYCVPGRETLGVPYWLPGVYLHAALFSAGMDDGLFCQVCGPSAAPTSATTADASAS